MKWEKYYVRDVLGGVFSWVSSGIQPVNVFCPDFLCAGRSLYSLSAHIYRRRERTKTTPQNAPKSNPHSNLHPFAFLGRGHTATMTYWWRHSYWNWAIECEDVSNIILSGRLTSSFVGHQKTFRIAFRCQRMLRCSKNEKNKIKSLLITFASRKWRVSRRTKKKRKQNSFSLLVYFCYFVGGKNWIIFTAMSVCLSTWTE